LAPFNKVLHYLSEHWFQSSFSSKYLFSLTGYLENSLTLLMMYKIEHNS
jgi:hypothetical protein